VWFGQRGLEPEATLGRFSIAVSAGLGFLESGSVSEVGAVAISTRFTELVGCELPLQLAPMGGVGTTELATAVAGAGGLGMVRNHGFTPPSGVAGTNFLMPFLPPIDRVVEAASASGIVEFSYGDPQADFVKVAHGQGALAGWQVGSAAEARAAEECGCDYVVAQGIEAGGHVRGRERLEQLLGSVRGSVAVPVLAAGGVATAERFAEVMRLGADGVRVGTRFVVCSESRAHPRYIEAILEASDDDATVLTEWFSDGWENAPHRVLASALEAARQSGWRNFTPPNRDVERDPGDMAMYAGTGASEITNVGPAAEAVADLVRLL
jgi:NAD(P)H-dependent flavin oxidoreductase YrpB (nitropropane dioxygenase family)